VLAVTSIFIEPFLLPTCVWNRRSRGGSLFLFSLRFEGKLGEGSAEGRDEQDGLLFVAHTLTFISDERFWVVLWVSRFMCNPFVVFLP
jgi:hypothetical protein